MSRIARVTPNHPVSTIRISDLSRVEAVWRRGVEVGLGHLAVLVAEHFGVPILGPIDELALQRYVPANSVGDK